MFYGLAYLITGMVFALFFVTRGVDRIDPAAGGWAFRLIIFPGAVALWPVLAARMLASKS